jgi:hypothetical protein
MIVQSYVWDYPAFDIQSGQNYWISIVHANKILSTRTGLAHLGAQKRIAIVTG